MSRSVTLADNLRQMIAVLEEERRSLAAMDLDALTASTNSKLDICGTLADSSDAYIDAECQGLLISARQLNEVNRRVRNLLAANVSARLDALTGKTGLYSAQKKMSAGAQKMVSI